MQVGQGLNQRLSAGSGKGKIECNAGAACAHLLIVKLAPPLAVGSDEGIVVAAVDAATVHEHAVQLVGVAHRVIGVLRQVLAVATVQVQLIRELISIVDLQQTVFAALRQ